MKPAACILHQTLGSALSVFVGRARSYGIDTEEEFMSSSLTDSVKNSIESKIKAIESDIEAERARADQKAADAKSEQEAASAKEEVTGRIRELQDQVDELKKKLLS
jgi:hypothetical protein